MAHQAIPLAPSSHTAVYTTNLCVFSCPELPASAATDPNEGEGSMASATSESYRSHLRGQLKEWERAFRSRNGRLPKQPDFEALEGDASARGRLVHGAYVALNRATGDGFIKVGGPLW